MARIITYPETTGPSDGDYLVIDNNSGTKRIAISNLMEDTSTRGSTKALSSKGAYNLKEELSANFATVNSSSSSGEKGKMLYDENYLYICVADNTWRRVALSTF